MKNLKMFAISLVAFAAMTMGVHATIVDPAYPGANEDCSKSSAKPCIAEVSGHHYDEFGKALDDAAVRGETIKLLANITSSNLGTLTAGTTGHDLTTAVTIDLGAFDLDLGTGALFVGAKGTLKFTGTGEVKSSAATAFTVANEGTLETSGALALTGTGATLIETSGKVVIGENGELSANTTLVNVTAHTANVTLNAKVGTAKNPAAVAVVAADGSLSVPTGRNAKGAFVKFEGGEYYTRSVLVNVDKGIEVTVAGGKLVSNANGIEVTSGKLEVTGGSIEAHSRVINIKGGDTVIDGGVIKNTSAGFHTIMVDSTANAGTLTINKGTISAYATGTGYALYLDSDKVETKVTGAQLNSSKNGETQYPAIYISDPLLKGLDDDTQQDPFKGMLTGGEYLGSIVGKARINGHDYTVEEVTKYLIAEGLEEQTKGDYKVLGKGSGNEPTVEPETQEPGTTEPGTQTPGESNPNVPDVPKTSDALFVYAGLGLVSALSVKFSSKRKED